MTTLGLEFLTLLINSSDYSHLTPSIFGECHNYPSGLIFHLLHSLLHWENCKRIISDKIAQGEVEGKTLTKLWQSRFAKKCFIHLSSLDWQRTFWYWNLAFFVTLLQKDNQIIVFCSQYKKLLLWIRKYFVRNNPI